MEGRIDEKRWEWEKDGKTMKQAIMTKRSKNNKETKEKRNKN